jgi:hypothetical protein
MGSAAYGHPEEKGEAIAWVIIPGKASFSVNGGDHGEDWSGTYRRCGSDIDHLDPDVLNDQEEY